MTKNQTISNVALDTILEGDMENIRKQLSYIGWKPNTSYQVERLPVNSYWNKTYNLSGIAIACNLPNVLRFAIESGETCCIGQSHNSNKIPYLKVLSSSDISPDEDVLIAAIIPSLKMGFGDDKDISKISRKAILSGHENFLSTLRDYFGSLSININDFASRRNSHEKCSRLLELYTSGVVKSGDFYPFIKEIARSWINLELDDSYEFPLSKTMVETILGDYMGSTVSIHKALLITNTNLSMNACLNLCKQGLLLCIDITGYSLSDCSDEDIVRIMPYYARQLTSDDISTILKRRETNESILAFLENRVKMQNHYALTDAIFNLIREGHAVVSKIIDIVSSNQTLNELGRDISNWKSFAKLTIPAENKKSYAENDWVKIAEFCKAKDVGVLSSSLSIKDKVAFIFSPLNMSASYILLKGLVDIEGLDKVGPNLTRKEHQEVLLSLHTPMEAMPHLPIRAQQKILKDLSSTL